MTNNLVQGMLDGDLGVPDISDMRFETSNTSGDRIGQCEVNE